MNVLEALQGDVRAAYTHFHPTKQSHFYDPPLVKTLAFCRAAQLSCFFFFNIYCFHATLSEKGVCGNLFFPSSICDLMILLNAHRFVDEFVSELMGLYSNSCTGFRCPGLKLAPERNHSKPHTHTEDAQRLCVYRRGSCCSSDRWRKYFGHVKRWQPCQASRTQGI